MNENVSKILLVDDDTGLTELLSEYLNEMGCTVDAVWSGADALAKLSKDAKYDLVVLDVMMPGMSGLELLPIIRAKYNLPVIMLTGRGEEIDRILGLEMGADDYIGKPCNPRELLARIRAVLRRAVSEVRTETSADVDLGGVLLKHGSRTVEVNGAKVSLTTAEFDVLAELMGAAGTVVSREHLTRAVLHRDLSPYDRSIDVHVSRVRNALKAHYSGQDLIITIRTVGYQFVRP